MPVKVGVVLSGCGVFDGSEIHEAVSILVALDKRGAQIVCMAPNVPQMHTINHLTSKPADQNRNVLEESARIARGKIVDLATVTADQLDALVFPGGFGAAKNLSDFASAGAKARVNADVARLMRQMHAAGKPIGLACIAPVLAAAVFGVDGKKPRVTIGTDKATAGAIQQMGGQHQEVGPTDVCIDEVNKLVTTPCYMNDVGPATVFEGAEKMVDAVLRMVRR
ncbi:MAG: isoprenoid biosynthesis glyoxalase ElbB [Phycisphaerae bacterium]|nr:isoprenoid biosynthesis glyoxalase ElbB [Phycisphaerae bacterium]MDW8261758.1 isoprenoid biosynthesis glyoxalase ElbB [Phycisphaerales bacterium]